MIPQDEDPLGPEIDPRDQPILVATDVEDRSASDLVCAPKIGAKFREVPPRRLPRNVEPVRQRGNRIGVDFAVFPDCLPADHSHDTSLPSVNYKSQRRGL